MRCTGCYKYVSFVTSYIIVKIMPTVYLREKSFLIEQRVGNIAACILMLIMFPQNFMRRCACSFWELPPSWY